MQKIKDSFHPYAAITIIFWSLAYVLTRLTRGYFSAFSLGFLRYLVASVTLVIAALITKMKLPKLKDIPLFVLSGAVGFFFYMIAFNQGQFLVTASTASVVIASVPVITALLARFLYGERLLAYHWAAVAVEFIGVAILTLMDGAFSLNTGLLWLIAAALALSVYNLIQRKLTKTYTALQSSTFSIFAGTILLAIFAPASISDLSKAPVPECIYVVLLGVFSSAIAYVSLSKAFSKANKTSQVSNYMFITPFLTSLLGFLIAKETPDSATLIGGGVIMAGVFIFNFGGRLKIISGRQVNHS
jgi:drug/metabolite transporter (DMT)-like permease